jgi:hypothetical protein
VYGRVGAEQLEEGRKGRRKRTVKIDLFWSEDVDNVDQVCRV